MKPMLLCILDGIGIRNESHGNCFLMANKPNLDYLINNYPHSLLEASGNMVGLPSDQMGNSEVGHTNIGSGRIVYQSLELINNEIKNGNFFNNAKILDVINHTKKNNSKLHIFGLLSDGGIHSHINHLYALIDMCKKENIKDVYYHIFLDGRDTHPESGVNFVKELIDKINEVNIGEIASIHGRFYAMDRDNRWDRIKKSYDVIVNGTEEECDDVISAIYDSYNNGITDEFIVPKIINKEGLVNENDGLIVFNYRPDRLRELFMALTNKDFNEFETKKFNNIKLVTMMMVSEDVICTNAYENEKVVNTLGDVLSSRNYKQLRIAETEKYAHVTYFFDGGIEKELKNTTRILIPSPKVSTYDLKPEMSAYEITDRLLTELDKDFYDVIILNFANGDMVGHTGNMEKTTYAVEVVDECLGKLYKKIKEKNGTLIVTADHGNADYMLDSEDNIVTSHSMSKVPFIVTDKSVELKDGKLGDIAPTILYLLNEEIPKEMTGEVLVRRNYENKER